MGQISIRFSDEMEKKLKVEAKLQKKTLAEYCRDLIDKKAEDSIISKDEIKAHIVDIEKQIAALNTLVYATMKQTFLMSAEIAQAAQFSIIDTHRNDKTTVQFIFDNAKKIVKQEFEEFFQEAYEKNYSLFMEQEEIEKTAEVFKDFREHVEQAQKQTPKTR